MQSEHAFQAYLNLANDVLTGDIAAGELPETIGQLPALDQELLEHLAQHAEKVALSSPRHAWAITQLADSAAHNSDLLLQARAAWYLARSCNHWGQPKRVAEAIARARQGFEVLNETGWLAACDWQLNHLSWTKPNFDEATRQLESALAGLERAALEVFALQCRLSLSYAQILIGDFASAQANLEICEAAFSARQDPLNLARCWYNQASSQRRQSNFDQAYLWLERALEAFERCHAPLDAAKTRYLFGYWYFLSGRDFQKAQENFEQAASVFSAQGMQPWVAVCQGGLAQINIQNGNLAQAMQELHLARAAFIEHGIASLTADTHNDSGQLALMMGDLAASLEHFNQAEKIYQSVGMELAATNALANKGLCLALQGRFQDALNALERSQKRFQEWGNPYRLAACELYLARIWADLNQYPAAHAHLDQAEKLYLEVKQQAMLGLVYNQRALIFSLDGRNDEAAAALKAALEISRASGLAPQAALAERRLGEMLSRVGQLADARELLAGAETSFRQMGMGIEQAASLASLGDYYIQTDASKDAEKAFQEALTLCKGAMPEIEGRVHAGLAALAEEHGDLAAALGHYREAVQSIAKLRDSFWQPSLAGSYLRSARVTLDRSVQLAAKLGAHDLALDFIEGSKAQTSARQLSFAMVAPGSVMPAEIHDLWLQIQAMQAQFRAIYDPAPWSRSSSGAQALQARLIASVRTYDERLAEIERKTARPISGQNLEFDAFRFVEQASARLGKSWLALDYYLTETTVSIVMLTPERVTVREVGLSKRARMALDVCTHSRLGAASISLQDLKVLGQVLLPDEMQAYLPSSSTPLIIAPHRELHSIPWAALKTPWADQALVQVCIPRQVPSLQLLQLIWQRAAEGLPPERNMGLLLGISDFLGKRPPLPLTVPEVRDIAGQAHPGSLVLIDADATWDALLNLADADQGLASFAFFHVASHINHDSRTGRLSSLALSDQEIALDHFRDLAPLPGLVTLSACNGAQSLVYEGDEHIGMANTCLIAGANTVIASLWPVLDSAAALSMTGFYQGFFSGLSPAEALAKAQRVAIKNGEALQNWAGFLCSGS